jgi:hypothetical protein
MVSGRAFGARGTKDEDEGKGKGKGVREPSKEENSRDLEVRRFAPVFMLWLKP